MPITDLCPCCSKKPFLDCCGRFLALGAYPNTAEQLMRSRYTAYTLKDYTYLAKTWHPDYRPERLDEQSDTTQWLSLDIIKTKPGLKKSIVEFKAYYRTDNDEVCLHEVSLFKKLKNRWVYVQAENF